MPRSRKVAGLKVPAHATVFSLRSKARKYMLQAQRALDKATELYKEADRREREQQILEEAFLAGQKGALEPTTKLANRETSFLLGHLAKKGKL